MSIIFPEESAYDTLLPLQPVLGGPAQWLVLAGAIGSTAVFAWTVWGRRWRADGVMRCRRCAHQFDPKVRFDPGAGVRCNECGCVTRSERAARSRWGRRFLMGAALVIALVTGLPWAAWNSIPVIVARVVLPRWVAIERVELPDGVTLVREVDPVQRWLGWWPNPHGGWSGTFFDLRPDGTRTRRPDEERLTILDHGTPTSWSVEEMIGSPPYQLGTQGEEGEFLTRGPWAMPTVGSPGFGADAGPPGSGSLFIAAIDFRVFALRWISVARPAGGAGPLVATPIGPGDFWQEEGTGVWLFERVCESDQYPFGEYFMQDRLTLILSWDSRTGAWAPDLERMRRPLKPDLLVEMTVSAERAYDECLESERRRRDELGNDKQSEQEFAAWLAGGASDEPLPCADMLSPLVRGILYMTATGHGSEWETWIRASWPKRASAEFRDRFIREMRETLKQCDCASVLDELNGEPSAGR